AGLRAQLLGCRDVVATEERVARCLDIDAAQVGRPFGHVVHRAAFDVHLPARRSARALLGRDVNDAVSRRRAVERRRGRSFDHFDVRDVFRIEVVEARRGLPADADHAAAAFQVVVHANAIDDDERIIAQREAAGAADANPGVAADRAAALGDRDTGYARLQHFRCCRYGRLVHRVDIHLAGEHTAFLYALLGAVGEDDF